MASNSSSSGALGSLFNSAAGGAQGKVGTTIVTLLTSIATGLVLFAVQFGAFLIVRNYLWAKRIYQPRCFLVPLKNRIKPPANNPAKWLLTVFKTKEDPDVLQKAGMDAYFFLRYLSMCLKIFFPMAVFILPILIPLNVSNGKGTDTIAGTSYNVTGLDKLAWGNVSPEHTNRYWAHLILAVGVIAWVCFLFHQELKHYIVKRQEFLGSPSHRLKASSTTVLITDIPDSLCNVEALTEMYDDFPGGLRRIWINRQYGPIVQKDQKRKKFENLLENAETDIIRKATKVHRKRHLHQRLEKVEIGQPYPTSGHDMVDLCKSDLRHDLETRAAWTRYLLPNQRKTMRIPKSGLTGLFHIPLFGRFFSTKVDLIYYCRRELARLNKEIESDVEASDSCPHNRSAFIQFNTQKAAHLACQSVADITVRRMTNRTVEISPADINWSGLGLSWTARSVRLVVFVLVFMSLLFIWGLIALFLGILSKLNALPSTWTWLDWTRSIPSGVRSLIEGTLPPVLTVVLLSGPLPILLRALTNGVRGATTGSQGERSLQLCYFIFLFLELFVLPSIASGITEVLPQLVHNPTSIPNLLATNLPSAADYFFSFLVVQAFSISASSILQTIRLLNYYVFGSVNTPDSVFNKLSWTNRTRIGSNIPWYTTFAVIGLVYSIIAPLMLIFMLITFSLFWIVIKNNLLYVVRTGNVDGGGLFFPRAINQTFTGLYFMEICLIGLFFLVRDVHDHVACTAQGIIMVVVLAITVFYQIWLSAQFSRLYIYAPVRLEGDARRRDKEYEKERLTASMQAVRPGSDSTVGGSQQSLNQSTTAGALQDERSEKDPHSPRATAASPRSKHIQAQQRKDAHTAANILARLNRPLDEARLAELETNLQQIERSVGNRLLPRSNDVEKRMMDDPISKIVMQHNDELEDLDAEERDMLISVAFTHPVLRETKPCVWIPQDDTGVSDDEVMRTRALSGDLFIDNRGAYFNRRLKVEVDKPPPDMSEFALVMAEL